MDNQLINIEIDGQTIQIRQGAMLIEAADEAGIPIPRFCYHKKLSIAANCRMCLVQVEKAPKPLPACATPVSEGMKVFTTSTVTQSAQKAVMEFLLINHPLDCPVCDQGGECELQDVALEYGADKGQYNQPKRAVVDKDIGPLIETEMTRCIHCTRCVRFGDEIAGMRELGATGRGEHMEIGTYLEHHLDSELSGNVIDVCPVGALTAKPSRFQARPWELSSRASVATHDCVGSNIFVHAFRNKVLRVIPRENERINENWLSDRDRFAYEGLYYSDRLLFPHIKQNGQWQEVSWDQALEQVVKDLQKTDPEKLGALASPSSPVEDHYLLQKLLRSLGSNHIDHRLHTADMRDQEEVALFPHLGRSIESLETCDQVFLIGGNVRKDQPMINHRLRKGVRNNNTKITTLVDYKIDWNFEVESQYVVQAGDYVTPLLNILQSLEGHTETKPNDELQKMIEALKVGENKAILLGSQVLSHPDISIIRYLVHKIAKLINSTVGELPLGANASGAWLAGCVPHRGPLGEEIASSGLSAYEMLKNPLETYLLMNIEPEYDCLNTQEAMDTLKSAQTVILMTPYVTQTMLDYATVLLPITPLYEMAGTLVNIEGKWQSVEPSSAPQGSAWSSWKILNRLGQLLGLQNFQYYTSRDVMREFNQDLTQTLPSNQILDQNVDTPYVLELPGLVRLAPKASFASDNVLRRAMSLQKTNEAQMANVIYIHPNTAALKRLNLKARFQVLQEGRRSDASFKIQASETVPENSILLQSGLASTRDLGAPYQSIELVQIEIL